MLSAIVMASGFSKRMKKNKLLMDFDGEIVIDRTLKTIKKAKIDEHILIFSDETVKEIGIENGFECYFNPKASLGQSESIKLGVKVANEKTLGYMFFVGDQPLLDIETVNKLIEVFLENSDSIIIPLFGGKRGNPVVFPSVLKKDFLMLSGDVGGRDVIRKNKDRVIELEIENKFAGMDIDTPEAFDEILEIKRNNK